MALIVCLSPVAQCVGAARVVEVVVLLGAYNNKHHFNPKRLVRFGPSGFLRGRRSTLSKLTPMPMPM